MGDISADSTDPQNFFLTGGTLPQNAPSYVQRGADTLLPKLLQEREFCYVLTARQMGKSSLMVRSASTLAEQSDQTPILLDLTALGVNLTSEQWYFGQVRRIGRQLGLESELIQEWRALPQDGVLSRWSAILAIAQRLHTRPLVIFVDEIDITRSLAFSADEFFAGIRAWYNESLDSKSDVTFCLLGVASPSELIQEARNSPFNIGTRIELHDFTWEETKTLLPGLQQAFPNSRFAETLLEQIYYWTGGHPYLTQRLCRELTSPERIGYIRRNPRTAPKDMVAEICERLFFSRTAQEADDNLLFVRDRLVRTHRDCAAVLSAYHKILKEKRGASHEQESVRTTLYLSGAVRRDTEGRLHVRNRIYERVFNRNWVAANMPEAERIRQQQAYRQGLIRATAISGSIAAVMTGLAITTYLANQRAWSAESLARHQRLVSDLTLAQTALRDRDITRVEQILEAHRGDPAEAGRAEYRLLQGMVQGANTAWHDFMSAPLAVALRPDGVCVVVSEEGLQRWDPSSNQTTTVRPEADPHILRAAVAPQGDQAILVTSQKHWFRWRLNSPSDKGLEEMEPIGTRQATALAWDMLGSHLAGGDFLGTVGVWDGTSGSWLWRRIARPVAPYSCAFSPDGSRVAFAYRDGVVAIYDAKTGAQYQTMTGGKDVLWCVAFSPDGRMVAACGNAGIVRLWDSKTGATLGNLEGSLKLVTLAFTPDSQSLIAAGEAQTIFCWNIPYREPVQRIRGRTGPIALVRFHPDQQHLISIETDGAGRLWPLPGEAEAKNGGTTLSRLFAGEISPNGRMLAAVHLGSSVSDRCLALITAVAEPPRIADEPAKPVTVRQNRYIWAMAFSRDGRKLFLGVGDATLSAWDTATGTLLSPPWKDHTGEIHAVALSPDEQQVASSDNNGLVLLRDLPAGQIQGRWQLPEAEPGRAIDTQHLVFAGEGQGLFAASEDGALLYLLNSHSIRAIPGGQGAGFSALQVSPDGKLLATAGKDRSVALRRAKDGTIIHLLRGALSVTEALAFSPDGETLVTGSKDGTVQLWDVRSGRETVMLENPERQVFRRFVFPPDNRSLIGMDDQGKTRVWKMPGTSN